MRKPEVLALDVLGIRGRSCLASFVKTGAVIDRAALTFIPYRYRSILFHAPVGTGKTTTPTPAGRFYVRDRLTAYASPGYGPVTFGTGARSPYEIDWPAGGLIGIHDLDQPGLLIPGRISYGFVRLKNAAILALAKLMPVGTPVTIR